MKYSVLSIVIIFILLSVFSFAQDYNSMREFRDVEWKMKAEHWKKYQKNLASDIILDMDDYDVKYWEIKLDVTDLAGQTINGQVTMTSEAVVDDITEIDYNFSSYMEVDSVKMAGQNVAYSHVSHLITITLDGTYNQGEMITTVVYFNGSPQSSGFGSFTWDYHQGQPIISTLSEPEGARDWWPCKDQPSDKADTSDIYITVPDNLVATSNGLLVSDIDNGDGTRTFHWHNSYPITTYLVSLAISNYQDFTDWYVNAGGDSMPIVNYVYPEHYSQAVEDLSITADAIEIFVGLFGEYPFINEKYGHSIFPWGGAMEHQCNTSYGQWLIRGDHYYDYIVVHELAHMWFGDMISPEIWPDIWMNEGFASYLEALWTEHLWGFDAYIDYMVYNNDVNDPSGPIYDPDELFNGNTVYDKGSWVLHMLRGVMGDEAFFDGMYAYATDSRYMYDVITTQEFQVVMEQYYNGDLDWFFQQWLWGMNRPWYGYSWLAEDIGNGQYEIFFHIRQAQQAPAPYVFTMPIQIFPRINGQDTLITVFNDSRIDDFRFIVNGNPSLISFDPDNWILKMAALQNYEMNIVTTEIPNGYVDIPYEVLIESRGGEAPYTYEVLDGSLPDGLTLDESTGIISGIPTVDGEYSFTIRSTDSDNPVHTDDQEYDVLIDTQIGIDDQVVEIPGSFELIGNYPNPFNASTSISFLLATAQNISLDIYNVLGQRVANLHNGFLRAGLHTYSWKALDAPSGIYFYKLVVNGHAEVKKMTLMK